MLPPNPAVLNVLIPTKRPCMSNKPLPLAPIINFAVLRIILPLSESNNAFTLPLDVSGAGTPFEWPIAANSWPRLRSVLLPSATALNGIENVETKHKSCQASTLTEVIE